MEKNNIQFEQTKPQTSPFGVDHDEPGQHERGEPSERASRLAAGSRRAFDRLTRSSFWKLALSNTFKLATLCSHQLPERRCSGGRPGGGEAEAPPPPAPGGPAPAASPSPEASSLLQQKTAQKRSGGGSPVPAEEQVASPGHPGKRDSERARSSASPPS